MNQKKSTYKEFNSSKEKLNCPFTDKPCREDCGIFIPAIFGGNCAIKCIAQDIDEQTKFRKMSMMTR